MKFVIFPAIFPSTPLPLPRLSLPQPPPSPHPAPSLTLTMLNDSSQPSGPQDSGHVVLLPHGKGGVAIGDKMPKKAGLRCNQLGALDHLYELERWSMRPHRLSNSEQKRLVAICTNPSCSFRFQAKSCEEGYIVVKLAPHTCEIEAIVPRKKRTKISQLPQSVSSLVSSSVAVKCAGRVGGGTAKAVQSSCKVESGVDISIRQVFIVLLCICIRICLVQSYYYCNV